MNLPYNVALVYHMTSRTVSQSWPILINILTCLYQLHRNNRWPNQTIKTNRM